MESTNTMPRIEEAIALWFMLVYIPSNKSQGPNNTRAHQSANIARINSCALPVKYKFHFYKSAKADQGIIRTQIEHENDLRQRVRSYYRRSLFLRLDPKERTT